MDCLFCRIGSGEIESYTIYEDDNIRAFLDIEPSSPGHTMIIPKDHCDDLLDLPDNMAVPVVSAVKQVARMLEKAFGTDNFTIGANSGRIVGRHVNHFHVHIIPRYPDDGGGYIQQVVTNPPKESFEEIREKILKANE